MSFKDESWEKRFAKLGDEAEGVFEAVVPHWARAGLNRPNFPTSWIPRIVRDTPDYWGCWDDDTLAGYYEVMGCGRDETIKLKLNKATSQRNWNEQIEVVRYFFWNARKRHWAIVDFESLKTYMPTFDIGEFPDNKEKYYMINWDSVVFIAIKDGKL